MASPARTCRPIASASGSRRARRGSDFDLSVAIRMIFSCLVDADYRDTEAFYAGTRGAGGRSRVAGAADLLPAFVAAFDAQMAGFTAR